MNSQFNNLSIALLFLKKKMYILWIWTFKRRTNIFLIYFGDARQVTVLEQTKSFTIREQPQHYNFQESTF